PRRCGHEAQEAHVGPEAAGRATRRAESAGARGRDLRGGFPGAPYAPAPVLAGAGARLCLDDLLVTVGDAETRPALGDLEQAPAGRLERRLRGQRVVRDPDPHLVDGRLGAGADLVVALGHDRDATDLLEQLVPEGFELGRRRLSRGEDAEVDAELERGVRRLG